MILIGLGQTCLYHGVQFLCLIIHLFLLWFAGSIAPPQEFTPSPLPVHRPNHGVSPNPSILNFTLQNLALIHNTNSTTHTAPAPEQLSPIPCTHTHAHTPLQTHGMIFIKPVSPLTLISLQQVSTIQTCTHAVTHIQSPRCHDTNANLKVE